MAAGRFGQVHALVVRAEHHQRRLLAHELPHRGVVGLGAGDARHREVAGQAHLVFEEVPDAAGVGFARHDREAGGGEKILRHGAPQIPDGLQGGVLFALDERLGIQPQEVAQAAQELGRAVQADRRVQPGPLERLAQHRAELAVQADVGVGLGQLLHVGEVAAEREHHVHVGADAFDKAANLGQVAGHVEGAVARADQVDFGPVARRALGQRHCRRDVAQAVFAPKPEHCAVRALPLVFVDRARQEALQPRAFGRDAAADHLGDRAGDHHRGQIGIEHRMGALHRAFGALAAELFFGQAGDDDRQLVLAAARRCSAART